jgi:predicted DNA-binding protein
MAAIQISLRISEELKERIERHVRSHGVTRPHLVEEALEHHLRALEELALDTIVPARIVLSRESAERVRELAERPPEPTERLKQPFDDR